MAGLLVLFLSHGTFTLKPEVRYLAGIVLTGLITLAFLFPVVIYSNKWVRDTAEAVEAIAKLGREPGPHTRRRSTCPKFN